jgi:hypothetical protein
MRVMDSMFSKGPYGLSLPKSGGHLRAPKPVQLPKPPKLNFADGGGISKPVPIMASDGEYIIKPEVVAAIGDGDQKRGHAIIDKWILHERKKHIKTLKSLPAPAKD